MAIQLPLAFRKDDSPADTRLDSNVIDDKKDFTFDTLIISGNLHEVYHRVNRTIRLKCLKKCQNRRIWFHGWGLGSSLEYFY